MKKIIISLSFVLLFFASFSQAPGYMGKKWLVNYNASGLFRNLVIGTLLESEGLKYSPAHAIGVSYVPSKNYMWSFEASFSDFVYKNHNFDGYKYDIIGVESNIGISFKIFKNSWIAPVGVYEKIGLYSSSYGVGMVSGRYEKFNGTSSINIVYGRGMNYVLADRFLFTIGIDFQADLGLINNQLELDYITRDAFNTNEYFLLGNLVHLNFGFGILL